MLDAAVKQALGVRTIQWRPFIATATADREYRGVEFADERVRAAWQAFWPTTGRQPSWDAVGEADGEYVLVEAKANVLEFMSPPSTASPESLKLIVKRLNETKTALGVHRFYPWHGTYYQYANRLAVLRFLRENGIAAHLVGIYFVGDRFPDGTPCPASREEWDELLEARRLTLGLPKTHTLSRYDHHVYLAALR